MSTVRVDRIKAFSQDVPTIDYKKADGSIGDLGSEFLALSDEATGVVALAEEQAAIATTKAGEAAAARDEAIEAASQIAYIDFASKPDGMPPAVLDSGQSVDYTFAATGRYPVIASGRLVANNPAGAGTGGLADYYQADLSAPITRVGVEYTMSPGADDGNGNATYAAWDGIYEGGGTNVPKSWVHMSIVPGTGSTGTAKWFVCNGIGNLFVIKQQTFANPPADGTYRWASEAFLDAEGGRAYAWLPDDTSMVVTDADIAYMCGVLGIAVFKFADLASSVAMCEHFCTAGANTAKFPGFTSMWAETSGSAPKRLQSKSPTPRSAIQQSLALKGLIPPIPSSVVHAPASQLSVTTTTSAANVDGANGRIISTAGPTGRLIVVVSAYYEWTATDTLFWRLAGTVASTLRAADVGAAGQKRVVTQTIEITGLTPGQSVTATLQHSTVVAGSATCKAGGSGSSTLPPITLLAIPA